MKKGFVLLLIITMVMTAFISCNKAEEDQELNQELLNFFPKEGFQWGFKNNDDYYHVLKLENISEDEQEVIYRLKGEVKDNNVGEINDDYAIEVFYKIRGNKIIQTIDPTSKMIESDFKEVVILQGPIEIGTQWRQEVVDKDDKKVTLDCKITSKSEEENTTVYEVLYKSKDGDYIAMRQIATEFGVVKFIKKNVIDGQEQQVGYALDGSNTGYIKVNENGEEVVDMEEPDDTAVVEDDDKDSATETEDDTTQEEDTVVEEVDEETAVETALTNFNDAWIEYVNKGDRGYFDHITTDGVAYKYANNFDRSGLTEEFLAMKVSQVNVVGSRATAKVYEEIKKTKNGEVSIAKYNWLYNLEKKDGKWLIDGYKKQ